MLIQSDFVGRPSGQQVGLKLDPQYLRSMMAGYLGLYVTTHPFRKTDAYSEIVHTTLA